MATNPTVVVGSLNDEEIKKTIDSLVEHVNKGMGKIVSNTNSAVDNMKNKLRELGTFKVDSSGTADGGSTRRARSMQAEQKVVQDLEMSYDKLLGALQYAQRQTTMYASKNPWSLSTEDLEKYEDAMRRVAEYEKQLASMQGNLALQRIQKSQFTPDMKEYTESLTRPSDELKKMSAYYRELEKSTEKQTQNQSRVVDLGTEQLTQSREQLDAQAKIYDARNEQMMQQTRSAQLTQEELDFERQLAQMRAKKGYGNFSDSGKARSAQETNELRGAIAGLLGLQEKEIQIVNVQDASYQQLSVYLGQLKKAYQQLDQEGMNASHGRMLADEIQRVSKAMNDMQRSMMRPTSLKNVMGLDEKSLDDIAYKMQQLATYRSSLNLTDPKQKEEFNQITQKLKELGKERDKLIGGNDKWIKSNNAVARSLNYIKNRLAFYLTVGASMSFVKQIIETRAQYEMLERSLGVLIDSAQRGTEIFREMQQMALVSPFTTIELADAAKQLVAYDIAAKDVVDTTRRLGDIAAAVGIPIERMTYALGQIKSYGYMTSINTRMFTRAGIPVVQGLADYYTQLEGRLVSMGDVLDRIKKRAVSYNDVMAVMQSMTDEGGKFFDYQAKMAETLKIQLANLNLAWQNMLNDMGGKYQSFISTSIKVTKELLLHWRELDTVLNSVGLTYAVTLGASIIRQKGILIGQQMIVEKLAKAWKDLRIAIVKATQWVMANPWTAAITVALAATIGTIVEYNQALEENRKLTKSLSDDAKEAADSLNKYLKARENMVNRTKAQGGKLNTLESEKAWESIRAEIEKSADSAPELITDLMRITDLNERVSAAFDMAERIEDANNKLSELTSKLKITHDVWGGFLGEGLAEDLEDLTEAYENAGEKWTKIVEINYGGNGRLGGTRYETRLTVKDDLAEAKAEVENFAKDAADLIRTELEDGVSDPVQVREAVRRIIKEVEKNNPQIRDAGKDFFESYFSVLMGNEFKDVFDPLEIQWNRFIEILKSNSSSLFRNLSDEILEEGKDLTDTQTEAIKKAFKELQSTLPPEFASLINEMQRQANENPLIIRYKLLEAFDVEVRNAWQKAFDADFLTPPRVLDDNAREEEKNRLRSRFFDLRMKQDETRLQYEKRLQDAEKDNKEQLEQTTYSLTQRLSQISQEEAATDALVLSLKEEQKEQQQLAQDIDNVQKAMMLRDKEDKKSKSGSKKDVLGDALSKEIQLINNVQSRFKDYQKMGVGANEAIARATEDYGAALDVINRNLAKFGMRTLSANELANMDLRNVRDLMRDQLGITKSLGNEKGVQALSDAITNINKEITSIDYKRITDGLNNELSKLKDEYELAVELDANPELGDMFAQMFGIDTDALSQTFGEAFEKANDLAKGMLRKIGIEFEDFDLMSTIIKPDKNGLWMGLKMDSTIIESLLKWQNTFRDMFKKNIIDTEKMLDDFVKKYGDYSDKIAEIEADKLNRIKRLNEAYYTEEMRKRPEYLAKLTAIEQGAEREKGAVRFDEFKNSRLYVAMFENLQYASTATLEAIRAKLEDLKNEMGTLSPEQLKQVTQQFQKIDQELIRRNPFKGLLKNAREYAKALGKDGKQAQVAFRNAQKNYDAQLNVVTALKEQLEVLKAQNPQDKVAIDLIIAQIGFEDEKLRKLREELELASELNDKYNIMRMIFKEQANEIGSLLQTIASNLQSLGELRDTLHDLFGVDLGDTMNAVVDDLSKVGEGISQTVSSAQSGNIVGVVTGAVKTVAGVGDAIASIFGDGAARTRKINKEINRSKATVAQLEVAYNKLERAVNKSLGDAEIGARRSAIANKQAQLAELERQLALEQSKRSKDRDNEAIAQLQENIQSVKDEIEDLKDDLLNTLWGSDIKSAAEEFVDTWVEAWRAGETTLDAIKAKMEDMVFGLVKRAMTSKIVASLLQPMYDELDRMTSKNSKGGVALTTDEIRQLAQQAGITAQQIDVALGQFYGNLSKLGIVSKTSESDKQLSALQQGIQGITEDTAGALEAYMNGVSQQVYQHTQLLTDIRDAVRAINGDIMLDTQAQMLLQLQQSYAVQVAIQTMLNGWSSADGRSVRVEMM